MRQSRKLPKKINLVKGHQHRVDKFADICNFKPGAMFALKRKKMYEQEVSKLQGAKISLESQAMALENAAVNVEILKSMKAATDAMKATRQNM